jgi:hypothetical protein
MVGLDEKTSGRSRTETMSLYLETMYTSRGEENGKPGCSLNEAKSEKRSLGFWNGQVAVVVAMLCQCWEVEVEMGVQSLAEVI